MKKMICDCCEMKEANVTFKVQKMDTRFKKWQEIDICDDCYQKLFNMPRIKVPSHK